MSRFSARTIVLVLMLKVIAGGDLDASDRNHDGRISREEFRIGNEAETADEAFACLDSDQNGYVSQEEKSGLRARFYTSALSALTSQKVVEWLNNKKCVPVNMTKYFSKIKKAQLTGPALWDNCVANPSLLLSELGITSASVRRTIIQVQYATTTTRTVLTTAAG
jgi:hypothetical protein